MKAYMKINGIDGEATETGHEKWIEVAEFHHGVHLDGVKSVSGRSHLMTGTASTREFVISKSLDAASPNINAWCAQAKPISDVTLHVLSTADGKTNVDYEVMLTNTIITSVSISGGGEKKESLPEETVAMRFGKISWEYKPRDKKNAAQGGAKQVFDFSVNKS